MTPTLTELRELDKRATQGEWENSTGFVRSRLPTSGLLGDGNIEFQTSCTWVAETTQGEGYIPNNGNAAFIAALVNWFRSGALEELERDAERWRYIRGRLAAGESIDFEPYGVRDFPLTLPGKKESALDSAIDAELRKDRK